MFKYWNWDYLHSFLSSQSLSHRVSSVWNAGCPVKVPMRSLYVLGTIFSRVGQCVWTGVGGNALVALKQWMRLHNAPASSHSPPGKLLIVLMYAVNWCRIWPNSRYNWPWSESKQSQSLLLQTKYFWPSYAPSYEQVSSQPGYPLCYLDNNEA